MPGLDDPVALAEAAALTRRILSRPAAPGGSRDALDPPAPLGVQGTLSTETANRECDSRPASPTQP